MLLLIRPLSLLCNLQQPLGFNPLNSSLFLTQLGYHSLSNYGPMTHNFVCKDYLVSKQIHLSTFYLHSWYWYVRFECKAFVMVLFATEISTFTYENGMEGINHMQNWIQKRNAHILYSLQFCELVHATLDKRCRYLVLANLFCTQFLKCSYFCWECLYSVLYNPWTLFWPSPSREPVYLDR
jgi:hypothetical protein